MLRSLIVCSVFVLLVVSSVSAQNTDLEALSGLEFNFRNPGARSLGMGGAFLALADDATAAEANPAGLTILQRPEVSLELRNFKSEQVVATSGEFPDLVEENFISYSRNVEVSFASVILPVSDNFALGAYYHQPLRTDSELNLAFTINQFNQVELRDLPIYYIPRGNPVGSGTPVTREECAALQRQNLNACTGFQSNPYISAVDLEMETLGLAGAWQMGNLSLGLGARYHEFTENALTVRFDPSTFNASEFLVQATALDPRTEEPGAENDVTFTAGFKWAAPSGAWSIGGVYKQGAEFDTAVFQREAFEGDVFDESFKTTFHVPDTAGIGIAFRPAPLLTISADAVWISYSNLVDNFQSAYSEIAVLDDPYEAKDITEIHVGAEYFLPTRIPFAVRAGWWREPAHQLNYVGPLTCTDTVFAEEDRVLCAANRVRQELSFAEGEDQDHFSVGVGIAFPRFQIDAAYDTADRFKVGSLSAVYRF